MGRGNNNEVTMHESKAEEKWNLLLVSLKWKNVKKMEQKKQECTLLLKLKKRTFAKFQPKIYFDIFIIIQKIQMV